MNTGCDCSRESSYNEEYIVEGYIENFNSNEEWWDAMSEHQFDGEIVILELMNKEFLDNLESQFDLGIDDLREIGNVKIGDWKNLTKIIGEKEVNELKKEYDDLEESNWIVILYYNKRFCTIVTSPDPYCI
tara:strand:- start:872 stop:1264 length:393 start_codon:yes stop_codon:yes gene_type:complete